MTQLEKPPENQAPWRPQASMQAGWTITCLAALTWAQCSFHGRLDAEESDIIEGKGWTGQGLAKSGSQRRQTDARAAADSERRERSA
jgi:hypothetical protein